MEKRDLLGSGSVPWCPRGALAEELEEAGEGGMSPAQRVERGRGRQNCGDSDSDSGGQQGRRRVRLRLCLEERVVRTDCRGVEGRKLLK